MQHLKDRLSEWIKNKMQLYVVYMKSIHIKTHIG